MESSSIPDWTSFDLKGEELVYFKLKYGEVTEGNYAEIARAVFEMHYENSGLKNWILGVEEV